MAPHVDPTRDFERLFGRPPEVRAAAPGRVNLIGEHTDYNEGFVLPMAIPQQTQVLLAKRPDRAVRGYSHNVGDPPVTFALGAEQLGGGWIDYVQGVTWSLEQAGYAIGGFDLWVQSDVPLGSGLSSSAALEVAVLRAVREAFSLTFDDVPLALLAQKVETGFVGAPIGVMDQMACSLASGGTALFLDTRDLTFERVALPATVEPVVINSGVTHSHATGDYRVRRGECEKAASLLGVRMLRELTEADLDRVMALPDPLGRRARHVVTENARVLATVEALRQGDLDALGRLLNASHESQRADYEVSIPAIDQLVELARQQPAVVGARLTGGGFGGSIVVLARAGEGASVADAVVARFEGTPRPTVLVPRKN